MGLVHRSHCYASTFFMLWSLTHVVSYHECVDSGLFWVEPWLDTVHRAGNCSILPSKARWSLLHSQDAWEDEALKQLHLKAMSWLCSVCVIQRSSYFCNKQSSRQHSSVPTVKQKIKKGLRVVWACAAGRIFQGPLLPNKFIEDLGFGMSTEHRLILWWCVQSYGIISPTLHLAHMVFQVLSAAVQKLLLCSTDAAHIVLMRTGLPWLLAAAPVMCMVRWESSYFKYQPCRITDKVAKTKVWTSQDGFISL